MTYVADDATLGKFVRRVYGLIERARGESIDFELLWDIVQGYLDCKLVNIRGVLLGTHRIVEVEKKPLDPLAEFFTTRAGLFVSGEFHGWILTPALAMGEVAPATVGVPFNLPKRMTDAEIRKELGKNDTFGNPKAFCLYLKGALKRQWGGVEGDLLINGYGNIFYVRIGREVFAVRVRWGPVSREWSVNAWQLNVRQWDSRDHAFPCN